MGQIFSLSVMLAILLATVAYSAKLQQTDPVRKEVRAESALQKIPALTSVPLKRSRSGPGLSFSMALQKTCFIGDWDIIEAEMLASDRPKLLLTIESLEPGSTTPPAVTELSLPVLRAGAQISLPIPEPKGLTSLGIFICKDSDGTGRCAGKPLASIEELTRKYRLSILSKRRPTPVDGLLDKTYFFSFVVVDNDAVYFANKNFSDESYQDLAKALSLRPAGTTAMGPVVSQIHAANSTLKSVNLKPHVNRLRLILPDFDEAACRRPGTM
jgi:hypothetical protein